MSDEAVIQAGFNAHWHQEIEDKVEGHDRMLRGGDDPGLNERVRIIERILEKQDEVAEADRVERKQNRFQYRLAGYIGVLSLAGLLIMAILDHTVWKPVPGTAASPVIVQQSNMRGK